MLPINRNIRSKSNLFFYIIGNNGSGKSTFLNRCTQIYSEDFGKIVALPCGMLDRFEPKSNGKVHYLGYRSKQNAVFLTTLNKSITLLILALLKNSKKALIETVLEDLHMELSFSPAATMWDKRTPQTRRASEIQRAAAESAIERCKKIDWRQISVNDADILEQCLRLDLRFFCKLGPKDKPDRYFPEDLSSGYVQKIRLLLTVAQEAEDNCLILIDEPEISLHVTWQAELPKLFRSTLSSLTKCVVVVATHSPVIISNTTQELDFIYTIPDGETVTSQEIPANIEKLLFKQFHYLSLSSSIVPETCARVLHNLTHDTLTAAQARQELNNFYENDLTPRDKNFLEKALEIIDITNNHDE
ncbi:MULTISPECIES: AAA family ATPase [Delftia]|uniref:AAA domain-containing protein, putative AbiEii toxin, Type IV TA system n=1 Tax=Delftia lacustris TaxID=558537 RepID=A0A1H3UM88_9BURK|nr:AAA family ATPase [Delftia lacustris]SDZ62955.1 AAA domain-containing protein, putative AbiEii toxin, Type IV TA system [Delftia lacustris]